MTVLLCSHCGRHARLRGEVRTCIPCDTQEVGCQCDPMLRHREVVALEQIAEGIDLIIEAIKDLSTV